MMTCSNKCQVRWWSHSARYWKIRQWVNLVVWSTLGGILFLIFLWIIAAIIELIFMVLPWAMIPLIIWGIWGLIKGMRSK
jgi:hypothetical protein